MRNIFTSRPFILLVLTFFCILLIVATSNDIGDFQWIGDAVAAPFEPASDALGSVAGRLADSAEISANEGSILDENAALRRRVLELEKEVRDLLSYRERIVELQEAVSLKGRFADLRPIGGNVITRSAGNWFDVFRLDVGERSGVAADMPVVSSSMALVGRIISTGISTSKAITILDEEFAASAWVSRDAAGVAENFESPSAASSTAPSADPYADPSGSAANSSVGSAAGSTAGSAADSTAGVSSYGGVAIVRGDLSLKAEGLCRLDFIPDDLDVAPGDIVETSGIGGVFPRGVEIGKVQSVMQTANGLTRYAIIKPFALLDDIEAVYVLAGFEPDMEAGAVEK